MRAINGKLMLIGGAEDKEGDCLILQKFIEFSAGGKIIIISTASSSPGEVGQAYIDLFYRLGGQDIEALDISDRVMANQTECASKLSQASAVFFTGGDQLKITGTIGGTKVDRMLRNLFEKGVVIAGTSAGAAVMSSTMIVGGADDQTPKKNSISMAPGMGFAKEVVIDQHFAQRGRIGRLIAAIAQNPYHLGIGIDEDTAIIIDNANYFEVMGSQTVTVINGGNIVFNNVSEIGLRTPLALTEVILHVLPNGHRFDLQSRKPLLPNQGLEKQARRLPLEQKY